MKKILFIGAGRMATAIAGGIVREGYNSELLKAFDINDAACDNFIKTTKIQTFSSNVEELINDAEVIFLAVKPQFLSGALSQIEHLLADKLIVSIVAGVSIEKLIELTNSNRIVRVMPNTPALIGKGCTGYTVSDLISEEELLFVEQILNTVGISFKLPERLMDAVTALSGSGPAYVFEFIDSLAEGGANCGLPMELALDMAIATCEGATEMLKKTKTHPSVLKDQVTSPGGTTMKALQILEAGQFRQNLIKAIEGACERSKELGRNA